MYKYSTSIQKMMLYPLSFAWLALVHACNPAVQKKGTESPASDPLPSWNEGSSKKAIIDFVAKTTDTASAAFIPVNDRIAVFDNDGTLWSEKPFYFQLAYAISACRAMQVQHPEWKTKEPFKWLISGDEARVLQSGEEGIMALVAASHSGMTAQEFSHRVKAWADTARHPATGKRYVDMVYQPMLELLQYLRSNHFQTFIVSGGGVDFIRAWCQETYGIPPYQVVGSSIKVKYTMQQDSPVLIKLPQLNFVNDKQGKPEGIHQYIGKRPVFAAGNSDGDFEMLQWTTIGNAYPGFGLLIHHTDANREWAYDSASHVGQLRRGLQEAGKYGWVVADMKQDWKEIYVLPR